MQRSSPILLLFRIGYAIQGGFFLFFVASFFFWIGWSLITKSPLNPTDLLTKIPLPGFIAIAAFFFAIWIIGIRMGWDIKKRKGE